MVKERIFFPSQWAPTREECENKKNVFCVLFLIKLKRQVANASPRSPAQNLQNDLPPADLQDGGENKT